MRTRILSALLMASAASYPARAPAVSEIETNIQNRIATFVASAKGAEHDYELGVAFVSREGGASGAFGFHTAGGVVDPKIASGVFHVASVSKIALALAFADLAGQDRVNMDARVSDLIPGFHFDSREQPTLRQLLEHRTGAQEALPGRIVEPPYEPLRAILDRFPTPFPVTRPPGLAPIYSNFNFLVAMTALESIVQQPFDTYMDTRFFKPWGLRCTGFRLDEMQARAPASGIYVVDGVLAKGSRREIVPPRIGVYRSAAGMISCPADLSVILQKLVGIESGDPDAGLSAHVMQGLERDTGPTSTTRDLAIGFAPGITVRQYGSVLWSGHNGIADGFMATLQFNRDLGIGYALMINAHVTGESPSLARLGNLVADVLIESVPSTTLDGYRERKKSFAQSGEQEPRPREGFYRFSNARFRATGAFDAALDGIFVRHDPDGATWTSRSWRGGSRKYEPAGGATWREPGQLVASAQVNAAGQSSREIGESPDDRIFVAPNREFVRDRSFVLVYGWALAIALGFIAAMVQPFVYGLLFRRELSSGPARIVLVVSGLATLALLGTILCLANVQSLALASELSWATRGIFVGTAAWALLASITILVEASRFLSGECRTRSGWAAMLVATSTIPAVVWMWSSGLLGIQLWNAFHP